MLVSIHCILSITHYVTYIKAFFFFSYPQFNKEKAKKSKSLTNSDTLPSTLRTELKLISRHLAGNLESPSQPHIILNKKRVWILKLNRLCFKSIFLHLVLWFLEEKMYSQQALLLLLCVCVICFVACKMGKKISIC